ncbi:hypothetical protein GCM10009809_26890 [Isoptericola hypogeus]|uniref:Uncharacterized protein n=1 Tax=Isoptericola hypogeus TaxID=300179 RepID=A0ABP4VP34_9MICO
MTTVHRLLDDAFSGVDLTLEVQDLKEEIRANLEARATELEATGVTSDAAARRAFDELGDVRALVADAAGAPMPHTGGAAPATERGALPPMARAALAHKVRPRAGFVVSTVLASIVGVGALTLAALGATGVLDLANGAVVVLLAVGALATGWLTGAALVQETTTNHPLPRGRAAGYGVGAGLTVAGAGLAGVVALAPLAAGWYVAAAVVLVAGVLVLTWLGATQTNRKKAWVREAAVEQALDNRFEEDPAAAARFGVYTAVIWLVALVVFVVLGLTVGWAWSWLAFVAATAVTMLVLARMLFAATKD